MQAAPPPPDPAGDQDYWALQQVPQSVCSVSCTPGFHKILREGQPACCYDCVPCADGEITNGTDLSVCLKCGEDAWSNEVKDMCIPRAIDFLSYEEPMDRDYESATNAPIFTLHVLRNVCSLYNVPKTNFFR
ncbi:hypothetical protein NDU88_005766 [Pleurodeles waltl]|uniref:GPCR family 3 nine cysteines domain-containing protein n=1 Tax=Pleurodeles waltl TaxID=8319 RepID=A0AAV7QLY8_PLEWA|nr:hypothetical protein NDU88_005766 [Pleurodeles waltl]